MLNIPEIMAWMTFQHQLLMGFTLFMSEPGLRVCQGRGFPLPWSESPHLVDERVRFNTTNFILQGPPFALYFMNHSDVAIIKIERYLWN